MNIFKKIIAIFFTLIMIGTGITFVIVYTKEPALVPKVEETGNGTVIHLGTSTEITMPEVAVTTLPYIRNYDYNDDGIVDLSDCSILQGYITQILTRPSNYFEGKVKDVNCDGKVDADDVKALSKFIATGQALS